MSRHVEHILLAVLLTTAALAFMGALFVEALPDRGGHALPGWWRSFWRRVWSAPRDLTWSVVSLLTRRRWYDEVGDDWRLENVSRPRLDGSAGQPPPAAGPGHPEDYDPVFWDEPGNRRQAENWRLMHTEGTPSFYPYPGEPDAAGEDTYELEACPNCDRQGFDGILCNSCGWGYGWQPAYEAQVTAILAPGRIPPTLDAEPDTVIDSKPRVSAGRHARPEAAWDVYLREGVPPSLEYVLAALTLPLPQVKALAAAS